MVFSMINNAVDRMDVKGVERAIAFDRTCYVAYAVLKDVVAATVLPTLLLARPLFRPIALLLSYAWFHFCSHSVDSQNRATVISKCRDPFYPDKSQARISSIVDQALKWKRSNPDYKIRFLPGGPAGMMMGVNKTIFISEESPNNGGLSFVLNHEKTHLELSHLQKTGFAELAGSLALVSVIVGSVAVAVFTPYFAAAIAGGVLLYLALSVGIHFAEVSLARKFELDADLGAARSSSLSDCQSAASLINDDHAWMFGKLHPRLNKLALKNPSVVSYEKRLEFEKQINHIEYFGFCVHPAGGKRLDAIERYFEKERPLEYKMNKTWSCVKTKAYSHYGNVYDFANTNPVAKIAMSIAIFKTKHFVASKVIEGFFALKNALI